MFKRFRQSFKANIKIEDALNLAEKTFGISPRNTLKQMSILEADDWRQMYRTLDLQHGFNINELCAMMVIPYVWAVEDPHHKNAIERSMIAWHEQNLIRNEVIEHFHERKNQAPDIE
ncbi:hypothetical protein ACI2KR_30480 [Pseudomonas luteola]